MTTAASVPSEKTYNRRKKTKRNKKERKKEKKKKQENKTADYDKVLCAWTG